jgi:hypothetical protein
MLNLSRLNESRFQYQLFIDSCVDDHGEFRLTPRADSSSYALCFAIFGYHLLRNFEVIYRQRERWDQKLREGLVVKKNERAKVSVLLNDKPYLQLLTFTLSALSILGTLKKSLEDYIVDVLPVDIENALYESKVLDGVPRSGNQAMFLGILLIYARDYLGLDTQGEIDRWLSFHKRAMNSFGFWGPTTSMSHLQFQNGYHQYELFEYLCAKDVPWVEAAESVASLADPEGHFAPYPGGGGCYDYDAVFILTGVKESTACHRELLMRTAHTILNEQNPDGGFCESKQVRPRSLAGISRSLLHASNGRGRARIERLRAAFTLLRPKHDRIHTHWSRYSREWGESDLWDSWFRMLTLARIDCAINPERAKYWGFINFPGIGFHPSVRSIISP